MRSIPENVDWEKKAQRHNNFENEELMSWARLAWISKHISMPVSLKLIRKGPCEKKKRINFPSFALKLAPWPSLTFPFRSVSYSQKLPVTLGQQTWSWPWLRMLHLTAQLFSLQIPFLLSVERLGLPLLPFFLLTLLWALTPLQSVDHKGVWATIFTPKGCHSPPSLGCVLLKHFLTQTDLLSGCLWPPVT